jgi:ribosomal silencing factor RsfS
MQISINNSKILTVSNITKKVENNKANRVITIDLSRTIKVLDVIVCCLEAGLINGKKYDGI